MRIYFVETEPPEREFFRTAFSGDELFFHDAMEKVPAEAEVISIFIGSIINTPLLDRHSALKLIATRSTAYDHIDLAACARRGVSVSNVANFGERTVTEHTFALLLALCRRLRQVMDNDKKRAFSYQSMRGVELYGKTLGVFGAGQIGMQTLRVAKALGMEPLACDIRHNAGAAAEIGFEYVEFDELLRRSHFLSVSAPLTPATYHLFNRETFAKCRRGLVIINIARGRIIDSNALIEALDSGIIGGAGLDVIEDERVLRDKASRIIADQIVERLHDPFPALEPLVRGPERAGELHRLMSDSKLLAHPNVVFTPHTAFNTVEAIERINRTTADNIKGFFAGAPRNLVSNR